MHGQENGEGQGEAASGRETSCFKPKRKWELGALGPGGWTSYCPETPRRGKTEKRTSRGLTGCKETQMCRSQGEVFREPQLLGTEETDRGREGGGENRAKLAEKSRSKCKDCSQDLGLLGGMAWALKTPACPPKTNNNRVSFPSEETSHSSKHRGNTNISLIPFTCKMSLPTRKEGERRNKQK